MRILAVVVSAGALIFRSMKFVWIGNGRVYTRLINGGSSPAELLSALASKAARERGGEISIRLTCDPTIIAANGPRSVIREILKAP